MQKKTEKPKKADTKSDINAEFLKAMKTLSETYWQQEMTEAETLFTMPFPDTSGYEYENKRLEANLNYITKRDSAKMKKLSLLRQMALMMSEEITEEKESAMEGFMNLLNEAQKRIDKK